MERCKSKIDSFDFTPMRIAVTVLGRQILLASVGGRRCARILEAWLPDCQSM